MPRNLSDRLFVAALICLSASAAGPIDFPLAVNTKWTYHLRQELAEGVHFGEEDAKLAKGNVMETTIISTVAGEDTIDGQKYARIESVHKDGRHYITEWYALGPTGLLLGKTLDENGAETLMTPPQKILVAPLQPGAAWMWRDRNNPISMNIKVVGQAAVQTPAGNLPALELSYDATIDMQGTMVHVRQKRWYVPGIGYGIQDTETRIGPRPISHVTLTLEKFEAAK